MQQSILDVFRRAFVFDNAADLKKLIQEVKGYLFLRDFASAFAKQESLDAYALRWSASRALGYTDILLHEDLKKVWAGEISISSDMSDPPAMRAYKVACIGGGAGAEVAACALTANALAASSMEVCAIDIADWSHCVEKLTSALSTPPPLSVFASEGAKAANKPIVTSDQVKVTFAHQDVLTINEVRLQALLGGIRLCTIMFTLNELFTTSISRTTAFLLSLTETMPAGSWLLVVDSPGSYSEVKLGQSQESKTRQYPMKWLLDHTLLQVASGGSVKWKKHVSDDSRWFRHGSSLKYPIDLENMRYQIHLYERVG
jgi:25S rRNA (uracil2843-N3)-methyltransferase